MTEIKIDTEGAGQVKLADEVIAIIAGTAALEVEGVAGMAGNLTGDIAHMLGRRNLGKGVAVEIEGGDVNVTLNLLGKFGFKLQEVSESVQRRVKTAIENMTGLNAREININITGILYYSDNGGDRKPLSKKIKPRYNES
ncbi:MAG: Asp23/Gls24 family envelope stress response protein [Clostridiales bacterium]|jgi:uncharacterized alkaline shock family protein YloU|nr:Asp23/Gls24 family envelope stress response protein [Clostridiales bacterium]